MLYSLKQDHVFKNVFTFGGAKCSGSDRECKYFPIGMNAHEPLWGLIDSIVVRYIRF